MPYAIYICSSVCSGSGISGCEQQQQQQSRSRFSVHSLPGHAACSVIDAKGGEIHPKNFFIKANRPHKDSNLDILYYVGYRLCNSFGTNNYRFQAHIFLDAIFLSLSEGRPLKTSDKFPQTSDRCGGLSLRFSPLMAS